MYENKNKIKNLNKIVSNRSRLVFTAFFLVGIVHSSQAATEGALTARLLDDNDLEAGRSGAVINTMHSVNGDGSLTDDAESHGFDLSPVHISPELRGDTDKDAEDLYAAIDTAPAEAEMNKIITCLGYVGGDYRDAIAAEPQYSGWSSSQLQSHLIRDGWSAATGGPLTEILQTQGGRIGKLTTHCKKVEKDNKRLEKNRESLVRTTAAALQKPAIKDIPSLQHHIIEINDEAVKGRTTIKYLKVALGSVITVASVGYATILTLMFAKK